VFQTQSVVPKLSAEVEVKTSFGFEVGFGIQRIKIDCQNDVQNAFKTTQFSALNYPNEGARGHLPLPHS
jgi:hypothetical protein